MGISCCIDVTVSAFGCPVIGQLSWHFIAPHRLFLLHLHRSSAALTVFLQILKSSPLHPHWVLRHSCSCFLLLGSIFNINEASADFEPDTHLQCSVLCEREEGRETSFMSDSPPWRASCWHTDVLSLSSILPTCMSSLCAEAESRCMSESPCGVMCVHL